jgi:uncharacterized membrane protein YkoI
MIIIVTLAFIAGRTSITAPSVKVQHEEVVPKETKMLNEEEIRKILLKRMPNSTILSIEIDKEYGILVYEGELQYNNKIYEFKIDAYSGVIIELEEDD